MENLTITELKAIIAALENSLDNGTYNDFLVHGSTWVSLKVDAKQRIKDLEFEQSVNSLPFPEN